jgi:hypothetical protein
MNSRYLQEILPSKAKKDSLNNLSASLPARQELISANKSIPMRITAF